MSILRQNLLTGNWTVFAPERSKKTLKPKIAEREDLRLGKNYDPNCPFCPGNEELGGLVEYKVVENPSGGWYQKVIENKYKIFDSFHKCPALPEPFHKEGIYSFYEGCGSHYLILEHPLHNRIMGEMTLNEIYGVFSLYQSMIMDLSKNPNNLIALVFKNQGIDAGGSQPHAHSQILGSRIVPARTREALHTQEKYFDDHGICPMCKMIQYEVDSKVRLLEEYEHAVVISPYAAGSPYEMWVVPKRHFACYIDFSSAELKDFARGVLRVLSCYAKVLDNPDFNFVLHSSPYLLSSVPYYHVYIQVIPRLLKIGGFELGTNIPVNSILPEKARDIFLRGCFEKGEGKL